MGWSIIVPTFITLGIMYWADGPDDESPYEGLNKPARIVVAVMAIAVNWVAYVELMVH